MYLPRYVFEVADDFLRYEFTSIGPKGKIIKCVNFTHVSGHWFNLGFGDLDTNTDEITDTAISNNGDSRIILATVAAIVHDFTLMNKHAAIFATGLTASRNRLYRMGISNHWDTISAEFEIYGWRNKEWEQFKKGNNYEAFLAVRKNA